MKKANKVFLGILNAISVAVIVMALFMLLTVVFTKSGETPSVFGYSAFRVLTGSMEPTVPTKSLIVVKNTDPSQIEVGDIITFYSPDPELGGAVNTHRVVRIEEDGGSYLFCTKGDANAIEDEYPVMGANVIGKVVWWSHFLGKAVRLLSNPIIFVPIIVIPLLLIIIVNIRDAVKSIKQAMKEEDEAAKQEFIKRIELAKLAKQKQMERQAAEAAKAENDVKKEENRKE